MICFPEEPAASKGDGMAGKKIPSPLVKFLPYKSQITWKSGMTIVVLTLKRDQMRYRKTNVDETEKELEMEQVQPSWILTQFPFPSLFSGFLCWVPPIQGVWKIFSQCIFMLRITDCRDLVPTPVVPSCSTEHLHVPAAAPLHRAKSSWWEIQHSHVPLWLSVPKEVPVGAEMMWS